jgi:hypothetical protein
VVLPHHDLTGEMVRRVEGGDAANIWHDTERGRNNHVASFKSAGMKEVE